MQWDEGVHWETYRPGGEKCFGFAAVRALKGLPPEILIIPLAGHTPGHCGIAIDTGKGWLLFASDAYFYGGEMNVAKPRRTVGLHLYQVLMEVDRAARIGNQDRLRELKRRHGGEVTLFCAHDALEFEALAAGRAAPREAPGAFRR